jgi:hypothetical protein
VILQHRLKADHAHSKSSGENRSEISILRDYAEIPMVECYPGQLNQALMNILSNAIDALQKSDQAKVITIRTAVIANQRIAIYITDNGIGMTEEVRSRIFDPFFTTKAIGQGTGLGLSISYQIITEKHGGQLSCYSKPNEGTEFVIELPIRLGSGE